MAAFILRKLAFAATLFLSTTALTFGLVFSNAEDPVRQSLGDTVTDEQVATRMHELGLDRPVVSQYVDWLHGAVTGDLGTSFFTGAPVSANIAARIPVTLSLVVLALAVTAVMSVSIGVVAAVKGGWIDRALQVASAGGVAVPNFLVAIGLVFALAISVRVFPATGYVPMGDDIGGWAKSLVLPVVAISVGLIASSAQQFRGAMIDTLQLDYIRTLRSRGVSERALIWRHALRNAASPGLTVLSLQTIGLIGGTVLIERVFGLPGVGQLTTQAALLGDLPNVMGCVAFSVVVVIVVNLAADLLNSAINPRIRVR